MADFGTLQSNVLTERFDPNVYRARVKDWINDANRKIHRRLGLPADLVSQPLVTVTGQASYSLPTGIIRVLGVDWPGHANLREGRITDLDDYETGTTAQPELYILMGSQLVLAPTPDAIYALQLDYVSPAPKLINDSDVPSIPEEYHDLLTTYGIAKAYRSEDDWDAHNAWLQDYELELARLAGDLQHPGDEEPEQVPGMWDDFGVRG